MTAICARCRLLPPEASSTGPRIRLPPRLVRLAVLVLVATAILAASLVPPDRLPAAATAVDDKVAHALSYAALALALAYALVEWRASLWTKQAVVFVAVVGYGGLIELAQALQPGRALEVLDLFANVVGALVVIGWYALEGWVRFVHWRETHPRRRR